MQVVKFLPYGGFQQFNNKERVVQGMKKIIFVHGQGLCAINK